MFIFRQNNVYFRGKNLLVLHIVMDSNTIINRKNRSTSALLRL